MTSSLVSTFLAGALLAGCSSGTKSGLETDWSYCQDKLAYNDYGHTRRDPAKDFVCRLEPDSAGIRCVQSQSTICEGGGEDGPHDVPNGGIAWFPAWSSTDGVKHVRCTCGCFTKATRIAISADETETMGNLAEAAKFQSVTLQTRDGDGWVDSPALRGHNFIVGKEEKPLIAIVTAEQTLLVTEKHPILVRHNGRLAMVKANSLLMSDTLLDRTGSDVAIKSLSSAVNPDPDQLVYNVATEGKSPLGHVILAEGLQVGDNDWQQQLDFMSQRQEYREKGSLAYLDQIIEVGHDQHHQ